MPPNLSAVLLPAACLILVALLVVSARIWMRLRALPGTEVPQLLRELQQGQRALREALGRLESEQPAVAAGEPRAHRFDRAAASAVAGPTLIAVPNLAAVPDAANGANAELSQRFGPIWALADEGLAPDTIARRTGQPIGQIELILGLRRPFAAQTAPHVGPESRD